jgi:hypothetical protein
MATGGIFQLITNDGKQDKMLMATQLLNQRLEAVRKSKAGMADDTPTLYDIEKTHILFTNAHFKPFAAIGFEYNKVSVNGVNFGSEAVFSIPQFGDFFNDMVVHVRIVPPTVDNSAFTNVADQSLIRVCDYPGERLFETVKFEVNGNPLDEYTRDAVNFHREFQVQPNKRAGWDRCVGQEQDEEAFTAQPNWINSGVAPGDVLHRSKVTVRSGLQTPTATKPTIDLFVPLLFWMNKDPRLSIPSVAIPYGQRFIRVKLAPLTQIFGTVPRGEPAFAGATAAQLASDTIPAANWGSGGTLVTANAAITQMELYINNIFVNPEVHNIFIKRIGFTLIRVHRRHTASSNGGADPEQILLQQLKWPIETLYVGARVAAYSATGATNQHMDKWHKFTTVVDTARPSQGWQQLRKTRRVGTGATALDTALGLPANTTGASALNDAHTGAVAGTFITLTVAVPNSLLGLLPVGTIMNIVGAGTAVLVNAKITANTGSTITFDKTSVTNVLTTNVSSIAAVGPAAVFAAAAAVVTTASFYIDSFADSELQNHSQSHTSNIVDLAVSAHGVDIYGKYPAQFYNSYIPYNYGGPNIKVPEDQGAMLVTFCLYPGTYQPSGHINVSRAREFYLHISFHNTAANGPVISASNQASVVVVASAINFLLISDGSAVLRYST